MPLRPVWVYLGEDLGTRKHFCFIRKIVKRRFFVDENLLVQTKGMSCTKQANGHDVALIVFQPIKQVGPTLCAEPSIGPFRRVVGSQVLRAFEGNLAPAVDRKCRAAAPASTGNAVAYMNLRGHLFALDANVTAKAMAQCWLRLNPSVAANECYPVACYECRPECLPYLNGL